MAKYVERFRPHHALARHMESRAFFEAEMRKPRGGHKLVAISHHAPYPGRFFHRVPSSSPLSDEDVLTAAYRSDLTSLMWPAPIEGQLNASQPADLWIYGHTDESEDLQIGHTRAWCRTPRATARGRSARPGIIRASIQTTLSKSEGGRP